MAVATKKRGLSRDAALRLVKAHLQKSGLERGEERRVKGGQEPPIVVPLALAVKPMTVAFDVPKKPSECLNDRECLMAIGLSAEDAVRGVLRAHNVPIMRPFANADYVIRKKAAICIDTYVKPRGEAMLCATEDGDVVGGYYLEEKDYKLSKWHFSTKCDSVCVSRVKEFARAGASDAVVYPTTVEEVDFGDVKLYYFKPYGSAPPFIEVAHKGRSLGAVPLSTGDVETMGNAINRLIERLSKAVGAEDVARRIFTTAISELISDPYVLGKIGEVLHTSRIT